ncbi:MAG: SGNH/GDSL hydrolase family protein [Candidatus Nitrohelix vancouverensis]|uniref:SGNH/GDSL hydrolase family protein n=1 Tax=Candidatus Nitrohelix vancouverensis TaxID=2705534 RepID=A0A7T0G3C2_9BACT|nr:MAG: SGNH/GDSL hydrolase family protein [Candidatus Nitrohelix vancouverensis]
MPDSKPNKGNKAVNIVIVLCVVFAYAVIQHFMESSPGSLGLAQWFNSKNIMAEHHQKLIAKVERDPHFKNLDQERFVKEMERIITMNHKRDLGGWVAYKSFTPNVKGQFVSTNDFGMRSKLSLRAMAEKARANKSNGIKNIILLGGSVAFGYGATGDEQSIAAVLNQHLDSERYEVFNLAQGGFTSFMDLFSLSSIAWHLEPDIVILLEGYADSYHLAYESKGGQLAWGLWSGKEEEAEERFAFDFQYHNLEAICKLAAPPDRRVILALQPLSGFANDSAVEKEEIEKIYGYYPKIRKLFQSVAQKNDAEFLDLSTLFENESGANINFFDKAHLTDTGQEKVAKALAQSVAALQDPPVDPFQLRQQALSDILN